jgi:hypothetical protein
MVCLVDLGGIESSIEPEGEFQYLGNIDLRGLQEHARKITAPQIH